MTEIKWIIDIWYFNEHLQAAEARKVIGYEACFYEFIIDNTLEMP